MGGIGTWEMGLGRLEGEIDIKMTEGCGDNSLMKSDRCWAV